MRDQGREFQLDEPMNVITMNMLAKSQETLNLLNPHPVFLQVPQILNNYFIEKEAACGLDKRRGRVTRHSVNNYSPLCSTEGPIHFNAEKATGWRVAASVHCMLDDINQVP